MKEKLSKGELLTLASMLFGMFFGAGNLIFPASTGQAAGSNVFVAWAGLSVTAVGIPLLAVAALGISKSNGLLELSSRIGKGYGKFFTCLLYLTIGPFFAIPRCATVPFSVALEPIIGSTSNERLYLAIFSLLFFAIVLFFSLRPSGVMTWIGKILNPIFLVFLGILVVASIVSPMGSISTVTPTQSYSDNPFFTGFIDGYNTMDALAGLAFGIVVVNAIKGLGVEKPEAIAKNTVFAGVFSCLFMAIIYLAVTVVCAESRNVLPLLSNGGEILGAVANRYFGKAGAIILAAIFTFACMKTSIGLITSCGETFAEMFPKGPKYKTWAIIFCAFSFVVANFGLTAIISYSVPVLMFLYPLAITLILLTLFSKFFGNSRCVYVSVTVATLFVATLDFLNALPQNVVSALKLNGMLEFLDRHLPLFDIGLGWVIPALVGLFIGLAIKFFSKKKSSSNG